MVVVVEVAAIVDGIWMATKVTGEDLCWLLINTSSCSGNVQLITTDDLCARIGIDFLVDNAVRDARESEQKAKMRRKRVQEVHSLVALVFYL